VNVKNSQKDYHTRMHKNYKATLLRIRVTRFNNVDGKIVPKLF